MAASELIRDCDDDTRLEITVMAAEPPSIPPLPHHQVATSSGATTSSSCYWREEVGTVRFPLATGKDNVDDRETRDNIHQASRHSDDVTLSIPEGHTDHPLPNEWWKFGVAVLYAQLNLLLSGVIITAVHERVPDRSVGAPLPDKFFDYFDAIPSAFAASEVIGLVLCVLWLVQLLSLQHKSIVGRRFFFLLGTLYMYRCVTMYVTTLTVPGKHIVCAPKLYDDTTGKLWRTLKIVSGGGLTMTASDTMCGDYLYSGHTLMLTLLYLFIKEYSPPSVRRWYHWLCWSLSATGVLCVLMSHQHYSVDVVAGYYVTSSLFWWYHAMASTHGVTLRQAGGPNDYLSKVWWNPLFDFLERNVRTTVPVVFSWEKKALYPTDTDTVLPGQPLDAKWYTKPTNGLLNIVGMVCFSPTPLTTTLFPHSV